MLFDRNPRYLLDTNFFIQGHRKYFPFDIMPGVWEFVIDQCKAGTLASIDKVFDEILDGDDLADWARAAPGDLFRSTADARVQAAYQRVMNWVVSNPPHSQDQKARFAAGADGWIVAFAMVHNCIVITEEQLVDSTSSKVKIPNACKQFRVQYGDRLVLLRELGARF